jgi:hypothetical protein
MVPASEATFKGAFVIDDTICRYELEHPTTDKNRDERAHLMEGIKTIAARLDKEERMRETSR